MIFKLPMHISQYPDDYAVRTPIREVICKIAVFNGGMYLYNKTGNQIAQAMFESNVGYLSISTTKPSFPGSIKIVMAAPGSFLFPIGEISKEDEKLLPNLKGKKNVPHISLRGDPLSYSYDIYDGNFAFANIVPSSAEKDFYMMRINGKDSNVLNALLIALAVDYFNHIAPTKK
jgi:hypothetical protein